jgi:hypothetical protein
MMNFANRKQSQYVWYFYKTANLKQAKEFLPSEEMDFITGIVDAVSDISILSINIVLKYYT